MKSIKVFSFQLFSVQMLFWLLALLFVGTGCATKRAEKVSYSAPSASVVAAPIKDVQTSVTRAKDRAARIAREGVAPGGAVIKELEADLQEANLKAAQAEQGLRAYSLQVLAQTDSLNLALADKNRALDKAEYWHGKQVKALKELWFWRGIAGLIIGGSIVAIAAWFGLRAAKTAV